MTGQQHRAGRGDGVQHALEVAPQLLEVGALGGGPAGAAVAAVVVGDHPQVLPGGQQVPDLAGPEGTGLGVAVQQHERRRGLGAAVLGHRELDAVLGHDRALTAGQRRRRVPDGRVDDHGAGATAAGADETGCGHDGGSSPHDGSCCRVGTAAHTGPPVRTRSS